MVLVSTPLNTGNPSCRPASLGAGRCPALDRAVDVAAHARRLSVSAPDAASGFPRLRVQGGATFSTSASGGASGSGMEGSDYPVAVDPGKPSWPGPEEDGQEQPPGCHSPTAGELGSMRSRPAPGRERC